MTAARITSNGAVLSLVPTTTPAPAPLSRHYNNPSYRSTDTEHPCWSDAVTPAAGPCDECAALQHESGGKGLRRDAQYRRGFPAGPVLYLCHDHAVAWQQRDHTHS